MIRNKGRIGDGERLTALDVEGTAVVTGVVVEDAVGEDEVCVEEVDGATVVSDITVEDTVLDGGSDIDELDGAAIMIISRFKFISYFLIF